MASPEIQAIEACLARLRERLAAIPKLGAETDGVVSILAQVQLLSDQQLSVLTVEIPGIPPNPQELEDTIATISSILAALEAYGVMAREIMTLMHAIQREINRVQKALADGENPYSMIAYIPTSAEELLKQAQADMLALIETMRKQALARVIGLCEAI